MDGINCLISIHIAFWVIGVFLSFAEFHFLFWTDVQTVYEFQYLHFLIHFYFGHCDLVTGHNDFGFSFYFMSFFSLSLRHDSSL